MNHEFEIQQQIKTSQACGYQPKLTRRESLKWLGLLSASLVAPNITAYSLKNVHSLSEGHWPSLNIKPINIRGYGKDPNLIIPPQSPWPKTLTKNELDMVAVLADILVPREGEIPSATEVNVPDVIDEWVSAPYPRQHQDRLDILHGLAWIDDESNIRFNNRFVALHSSQRLEIVDDIAYDSDETPSQFRRIASVFTSLRRLVLAAFFCSPQGTKNIGYVGNVAIAGDYPGPSREAMKHLDPILKKLGLQG